MANDTNEINYNEGRGNMYSPNNPKDRLTRDIPRKKPSFIYRFFTAPSVWFYDKVKDIPIIGLPLRWSSDFIKIGMLVMCIITIASVAAESSIRKTREHVNQDDDIVDETRRERAKGSGDMLNDAGFVSQEDSEFEHQRKIRMDMIILGWVSFGIGMLLLIIIIGYGWYNGKKIPVFSKSSTENSTFNALDIIYPFKQVLVDGEPVKGKSFGYKLEINKKGFFCCILLLAVVGCFIGQRILAGKMVDKVDDEEAEMSGFADAKAVDDLAKQAANAKSGTETFANLANDYKDKTNIANVAERLRNNKKKIDQDNKGKKDKDKKISIRDKYANKDIGKETNTERELRKKLKDEKNKPVIDGNFNVNFNNNSLPKDLIFEVKCFKPEGETMTTSQATVLKNCIDDCKEDEKKICEAEQNVKGFEEICKILHNDENEIDDCTKELTNNCIIKGERRCNIVKSEIFKNNNGSDSHKAFDYDMLPCSSKPIKIDTEVSEQCKSIVIKEELQEGCPTLPPGQTLPAPQCDFPKTTPTN